MGGLAQNTKSGNSNCLFRAFCRMLFAKESNLGTSTLSVFSKTVLKVWLEMVVGGGNEARVLFLLL